MNNLERKMLETLKDLKANHHVIGIKAGLRPKALVWKKPCD